MMATDEPELFSNPIALGCAANPQEIFYLSFLQEVFYETRTVGRDFCHSRSHGTRRCIINLRFVSLEEAMIDRCVAAT